jgi:hypothetical protein
MKVSNANPDNFLNLDFLKMIEDPIAEMSIVYQFIDQDFTDQAENAMTAWKEENQHEMGSHQYSLEEFGLAPTFIETNFNEYINQYIDKENL